jgi:hypothetical protein
MRIHQQAHQLRHHDGGVRVVELNGDAVIYGRSNSL